MAILILSNSHRIVNGKELKPAVAKLVAPFKHELWPIYFELFSTAKMSERVEFFKEELIRELWPRFIADKEAEINVHIATI